MKLKPGLGTFYIIQPYNGMVLFYRFGGPNWAHHSSRLINQT